MKIRTTRKTVTIEQSFSLRGCAQALEPGAYEVDTDEQELDGVSFLAHQRIRTFIHLHRTLGRPGVDRIMSVSGDDLDTAIAIARVARNLGISGQSASAPVAEPNVSALDRANDKGMIQTPPPPGAANSNVPQSA